MCRVYLVGTVALVACNFDSQGQGSTIDSLLSTSAAASSGTTRFETSTDGITTSDTVTTTSSTSSSATTTTTAPNTGTGSETSESSSDEGPIDCSDDPVINRLFWIEDATVSEMDSFTADLPGSPTAVRTVTANTGQAVLTIDVPCSGTYVFFGLVWERFGSVAANQPDSFFVRVDDSDLVEWVYGCQTQAGDDSTWQWLRVAHRLASGCQIALVAAELEAGQHVMRIIGREGTQNLEDLDFSAIAAIAISNDPSYDPADDYDPYP